MTVEQLILVLIFTMQMRKIEKQSQIFSRMGAGSSSIYGLSNTILLRQNESLEVFCWYWTIKDRCWSPWLFNPSPAGAEYIRVFILYYRIKYQLLHMLEIKCDINQQYLKTVDPHFVKSENFHSLEVVDRVSET